MINLKSLKTSLTKHGAHKVAKLIERLPRDKIIENITGKFQGINIERVQTQKNLSAYPDGIFPEIWDEVKSLGSDSIRDLVFIAIVFSHHRLIEIMSKSGTGDKKGTVNRIDFKTEKEYTNFANDIEELGFMVKKQYGFITYDLTRIFSKLELIPLILELLTLKLKTAGWKQKTDFFTVTKNLEFYKVFSVSKNYFIDWLSKGYTEEIIMNEENFEDEPVVNNFSFKSGHVTKTEVSSTYARTSRKLNSVFNHNKMQNQLYSYLASKYGEENVGTEVDTGFGKRIDIVRKEDNNNIFYEIKTEKTIRSCIRQALPQIMEYAYWPEDERAKMLIIVAQNEVTEQAKKYLKHLRNKFKIPIFYQQFDLREKKLSELF